MFYFYIFNYFACIISLKLIAIRAAAAAGCRRKPLPGAPGKPKYSGQKLSKQIIHFLLDLSWPFVVY